MKTACRKAGTVNSPILFNIYTSNVLTLFGWNSPANTNSITFADDVIIYYADKGTTKIQEKLQDTLNRIQTYYYNWKLKINVSKCETILFPSPLSQTSRNTRRNYKHFKLIDTSETG